MRIIYPFLFLFATILLGSCGVDEVTLPILPAVGNYYYADGSNSATFDSQKDCIGIIFWVDPADATKGKIVSLDEISHTLWSRESKVVGAASFSDGAVNTDVIKKIDNYKTLYPAAAWCAGKSAGGKSWYLPARDELQHLYCAYEGAAPLIWGKDHIPYLFKDMGAASKFNTALSTAGMEFSDTFYWSSTENDSGTAWNVSFREGCTPTDTKAIDDWVRCVSAF